MSVFIQPIYTQTVGSGGVSTVTFNNIPQTFTDLMIEFSARDTSANASVGIYIRLNNDTTGGDYSMTALQGSGTGVGSSRNNTDSGINVGVVPAASATSNTFGNGMIYISNYTSSNWKQIICDVVQENNQSTAYQDLRAGLFHSTAAITRFDFLPPVSGYAQYSTFTIYGILRQGI
jgi:hypothetical protein